MATYNIALLPGDGIGPECMAATEVVLGALAEPFPDLVLNWSAYRAGAERFRETGVALPDDVLQSCLDADAVLLSAIGLPDVRMPDGTEVQPTMMVGLRRALNVYAAVRPVKLYKGAPCALRDAGPGIDFVIIRENLEGLFASFGGGAAVDDEVATDTLIVTRRGTARVAKFAFELAQRRAGRPTDGKKMVTCVDKANVFRSFAFFRSVFFDVAREFSDVAAEAVYVDAMSLYMVTRPWDFDVVVTENQFGDILSDLGAGLVGGLGLGPSGEIGEDHGLFQPSHGTAPQIAGQGIANPMATVLSAAMMLDWLGDRHGDANCLAASRAIEDATARVLRQGQWLTPDLGGRASTMDVAKAIAAELVEARDAARNATT
ncbi:MAG: isocitrate/isopropylmalate dehydrogenase family protein [Planctomycetota bacterium]|nr:MAG: isocitrate/isopropylmalate dehydrogenase family protein [Planctomycetota bacterium]